MLVGPNGAGKTNLIEAISFLTPGRGLRRATLRGGRRSPRATAPGRCRPRSRARSGLATLGTGIEPPAARTPTRTRLCRIDREPVGSAAAFADHLRVVWLTPAMDSCSSGPASERRRFLDRLVLAVDAEHPARVNALERALRSRNRLLEDPRPDPHWLDAIEHETAELAVAVAAQRAETVRRLQRRAGGAAATRRLSRRPRSRSTAGWSGCCRTSRRSRSRIAIARVLRDNRARDAAAGRTLDGPHLTDLDGPLRAEGHRRPPMPRPASRRRC